MKTRSHLLPFATLLCLMNWIGLAPVHSATEPASAIPWSEIGAKAGADYKGDGLSVSSAENGARLRCVFQRLEGEATREGLWLSSTASDQIQDRFRIVAAAVGRGSVTRSITERGEALRLAEPRSEIAELPRTGNVIIEGRTVRFIRAGLVEEYTVSMDGVRQDFIVEAPPLSSQPSTLNQLRVELQVSGARVEQTSSGARLVLENSGRKIAYSRLRVNDATGRELPARMETASAISSLNSQASTLNIFVNDADAVYPIRIDPTFSDNNWISISPSLLGADAGVYAAVVDGSGNLYIGGSFTVVGDVIANRIAKWNGSSWSALGSGIGAPADYPYYGGSVEALVVSGSDLYAGGLFTSAGGVEANNIAKWDGSSWSALGSGMNGDSPRVSALAVSGSDLYAGGAFTAAGGIEVNRIAKWNGSSWSALGSGMNNSVYALAVSGSTLYAGGGFGTAGGVTANNIAKWNGSSWSALGSGMNDAVAALAVSGSDLYAGGFFTTAGGVTANKIAKWNGSSWSPLGSGFSFDGVYELAVSGSDLYAGGGFIDYSGSIYRIAKWNGSSWSPLGSGMDSSVQALAVSGSTLYAGGYFGTAGGVEVNRIAKWNGTSWSPLGSGMSRTVRALAVSGSDLYAGGDSLLISVLTNNIAKWNGSSWSALSGMNGDVLALAVSGTNLYAGGSFTTAGGVTVNRIAKWNGSSWSALGSGMNNSVLALAVSGSTLYAGGWFTNAGGVTANRIAKWNGSSWSALGSGMDSRIGALAMLGSDLYAGGFFTTAGGVTANGIAKWNGSSWSALGSGPGGNDRFVYALAVSGSNLYVGGRFTTAGGITVTRIAKWNGSTWSALGSGMNNWVRALAVSGSDLYAGGDFTTAGGISANGIAKWNGSSWSALGSGMGGSPYYAGQVHALAVSGSGLYAGGFFTTAGGKVSAYVAQARISFTPNNVALTGNVSGAQTNTLTFTGVPNYPYIIQYATNLTGSPWFTLSTNVPPDAKGVGTAIDPATTDPQRFYRVGYQE